MEQSLLDTQATESNDPWKDYKTTVPLEEIADVVFKKFKLFAAEQRALIDRNLRLKARRDREAVIQDLRSFAVSFKLETPVPTDLILLLTNDPLKQSQMLQRSERIAVEIRTKRLTMEAKPLSVNDKASSIFHTQSSVDQSHHDQPLHLTTKSMTTNLGPQISPGEDPPVEKRKVKKKRHKTRPQDRLSQPMNMTSPLAIIPQPRLTASHSQLRLRHAGTGTLPPLYEQSGEHSWNEGYPSSICQTNDCDSMRQVNFSRPRANCPPRLCRSCQGHYFLRRRVNQSAADHQHFHESPRILDTGPGFSFVDRAIGQDIQYTPDVSNSHSLFRPSRANNSHDNERLYHWPPSSYSTQQLHDAAVQSNSTIMNENSRAIFGDVTTHHHHYHTNDAKNTSNAIPDQHEAFIHAVIQAAKMYEIRIPSDSQKRAKADIAKWAHDVLDAHINACTNADDHISPVESTDSSLEVLAGSDTFDERLAAVDPDIWTEAFSSAS